MIEPGIYFGMSMADYLAIPALSQGPAFACINDCPAAGWFDSYLNPEPPDPDDSNESDIGTAAHAIILEGSADAIAVIDPVDYPAKTTGNIPDGWTNKAIRMARDDARAAGKIPILKPAFDAIQAMAASTASFIAGLKESEAAIAQAFDQDGGHSEVTIVWKEGDVLCKLRADRVSKDWTVECNLKTTPGTVEPNAWGRTQLFGAGYYFGAEWYNRGIFAATGVVPANVFLAQSTKRPYRCVLIGVDPAVSAYGEAQVKTALQIWQRCAAKNDWPSYSSRIHYPELPTWMQAQWEEREAQM